MKNNILVTSGGFNSINNYVSDDNVELFKEISSDKKVMVLANAAPEGTGNYVARENVKENFLSVGAKQVDVIDLDESSLDVILDYDVIYALGGDVTPLLKLNNNPKLKKYISIFRTWSLYRRKCRFYIFTKRY
ncbi:MAG: hypothetical protein J6M60_04980 [Clostridia bacterium]|nr:hypothetical protein [Clostridia bacterium]